MISYFRRPQCFRALWTHLAALAVLLFAGPSALALEVSVVDSQGNPISVGFKWLVEEDATFANDSDATMQTTNFHKSYMPVIASGRSASASASLTGLPLDRPLFVSVLPDAGFTMSGGQVAVGQQSLSITVHELPIPTAQISILVFEDNSPLNNAPDGGEVGLEGFSIVLEEAGGKYGASGGQVMLDAFGNMIGTEYNPDGTVASMGDGTIYTDANGLARVKNLAPGKYGIIIIPPTGSDWVQVTTIEGTKVTDAWVKANEPSAFVEFGIPGPHVFVGFVRPTIDETALTGGATITGSVVSFHISRPPFYSNSAEGAPFPNSWIGLNDPDGRCVYAQPADPETGEFSIPNVPAGIYQLVLWDEYLDVIIGFRTINVPENVGEVALGAVQVPDWFAHVWNQVFNDVNENGFPDPGEKPMMEQNINLRFRDGTVYQAMPTDVEGWSPFDEAFPFFNWLVAEVDFARFKATGLTVVVDEGGTIYADHGFTNPSFDRLSPQPQPENGGEPFRTELGAVLTQGVQSFLGQTVVLFWGKTAYGPNENGGISGVVFYAITRAENDPRYAAGEEWEPGIPRVQVNLYADDDTDGFIDDLNQDGMVTLADVDNYPFGWMDGGAMGPEDEKRDGSCTGDPCPYSFGDALQVTSTDSWDDNLPTDCPGDPTAPYYLGGKCYDGLPNYNQARPGVFDGGYAFNDIETGTYIVEAVPPPGYELMKEEDKNVDFGDSYEVSQLLLPPVCVGDLHTIPQYLSFQTDESGTPLPGIAPEELIEAPWAGQDRVLCDRKQVFLNEGKNAAADFWLFTQVPIAAHFTGMVLNDLAAEFEPTSFNFGEKIGPPNVPVSIRDWTGKEVTRVYTDRYGNYNGLVPSSYSVNLPIPSGVSPSMYNVCINDIGPIPDPDGSGQMIADPLFRRDFGHNCYSLQFMAGSTSYLDTPVLPVSAFAGQDNFPVDCEFQDGEPVIYRVDGTSGGPYVEFNIAGTVPVTLTSMGPTPVRNPAFSSGSTGEPLTIPRDFGFGAAEGQVLLNGSPLVVDSWSDAEVVAMVPIAASTGQLEVVRGDNGVKGTLGVTLTLSKPSNPVTVLRVPSEFATIQSAIDAASEGALILIAPGTYDEKLIVYKGVALQGYGAYSTTVNALSVPAESLQQWTDKVIALTDANPGLLLDGQTAGAPSVLGEGGVLQFEQGATVLVLASDGQMTMGNSGRIDGLTLTGSSIGGGVILNGRANYFQISNNRVMSNQGFFGGGIRLGHAMTAFTFNGAPVDAQNDNVSIFNNQIAFNGSVDGGGAGVTITAGGGISLYTGSDGYSITDNLVCGNFTTGSGAGIGHFGLSDGGLIARNKVRFNESFHQSVYDSSGGGLSVEGLPVNQDNGLTTGSGSVVIDGNIFQGNLAGAGEGGGIRLSHINGQEVSDLGLEGAWQIDILNNFIINNVAGGGGAGISLRDAINVNIINNTIAHNDSTSTSASAFVGAAIGESTELPSGIASFPHGPDLETLLGELNPGSLVAPYSQPLMLQNILRKNRTFRFSLQANDGAGALLPNIPGGDPSVYWDTGVMGTDVIPLVSDYSILTDSSLDGPYADPSNILADPLFVDGYFNGSGLVWAPQNDREGQVWVAPAVDEGGNWINVHFGPLSPVGDYHIQDASPGANAGILPSLELLAGLGMDIDGDIRPFAGTLPDIGADETESLVVNAVPPHITSLPITQAVVGMDYIYDVDAVDTDPGDAIAFSIGQGPAGLIIDAVTGVISWVPGAGAVGNHTISVVATDNYGLQDVQTYTLTVQPANRAPVAVADSYIITRPGYLVVAAPGVLLNDSDPDGDIISALQETSPANGYGWLFSSGLVVYFPGFSFVGTGTFTYKAFDGALRSAETLISIYRELYVSTARTGQSQNGLHTWLIRGLSAVPGSVITAYLGPISDGIVIGTATVSGNGRWQIRERNSTVAPGTAQSITLSADTGYVFTDVSFSNM